MTVHDSSLHQEKRGLLDWFGRPRAVGDLADLSVLAGHLRAVAPGSRAHTIAGISEFMDQHDLDLCAVTLSVAYDYVVGSDPLLVRLIDERAIIGQPITVDWLKKLRGQHRNEAEENELPKTFEKLEKYLVEFAAAASSARKATDEYNSSLEGHAEQLNSAPDNTVQVGELLATVRGMIARTAEMAQEMERNEKRSESLQKDLAAALRSAEEDYLTGLPNRRSFEKTFEHEYREARAAMENMAVAFCDIDHFKRINDTHGHETGDRVLKAVARTLSEISCERSYIARHGGEEFVVLFRDKSLSEAMELLDKVRNEMSERRLVNRLTKAPIGHVTFSAGIADVFAYADRRAALKAADTALYLAKDQGRNQVVAAASH